MSAQKTITRLRKQLKEQMDYRLKNEVASAERNELLQAALRATELRLEEAGKEVAQHERTIADLEAKLKDAREVAALSAQLAQNNTRLTLTLDNMAKAAAGLVMNTQAA